MPPTVMMQFYRALVLLALLVGVVFVPPAFASDCTLLLQQLDQARNEWSSLVRTLHSSADHEKNRQRLVELHRDYIKAFNEHAKATGGNVLIPMHPKNRSFTAIDYSEKEMAERRLYIRDGLFYKADGALFDTSEGEAVFSPGANYPTLTKKTGLAIFTMDEYGQFYHELRQQPGRVHHNTIAPPSSLENMPFGKLVAGAGEIRVHSGKLLYLNDKSGHYLPPKAITNQVLRNLEKQGIDTSAVEVDLEHGSAINRPLTENWFQSFGVE